MLLSEDRLHALNIDNCVTAGNSCVRYHFPIGGSGVDSLVGPLYSAQKYQRGRDKAARLGLLAYSAALTLAGYNVKADGPWHYPGTIANLISDTPISGWDISGGLIREVYDRSRSYMTRCVCTARS